MEENSFGGFEKLEFREIVLGHIRKILDLSFRPNNDGNKWGLYISSINSLSDVLIPFYDERMEKEFDEFETNLRELYKEKSEKWDSLSPSEYSKNYEPKFISIRNLLYRNLFRKLNLLLKRNDYLKSSVYGEEQDEIVEEDEEDE